MIRNKDILQKAIAGEGELSITTIIIPTFLKFIN